MIHKTHKNEDLYANCGDCAKNTNELLLENILTLLGM
jgi:hypothetical protein